MKIILTQDVVNLGEEGDVRVVKDGYARNYLLPTGAAVIYNKTNEAIFKSRAAQIEKRKEEKRKEARSLKEKLDELTIQIVVSAGESGKLFGSVTSQMVQEELKKNGFEIERKKIEVATHAIKMTGSYTVLIHLYENESSKVKLNVVSVEELKALEKKAEEERKQKEEEERKAEEERLKAEAEVAAAEATVSEEASEEVAEESTEE